MKNKGKNMPFSNRRFLPAPLRKSLAGNPGKLPLDFTCEGPAMVPFEGYDAAAHKFTVEWEQHDIKVLPSCRLPKCDPGYYLHRIMIKCVCSKWLDIGHANQHVCSLPEKVTVLSLPSDRPLPSPRTFSYFQMDGFTVIHEQPRGKELTVLGTKVDQLTQLMQDNIRQIERLEEQNLRIHAVCEALDPSSVTPTIHKAIYHYNNRA